MTREEMWEEFENQLKREVHTPITMSYDDSIRLAELGIKETVSRWKERLEQEPKTGKWIWCGGSHKCSNYEEYTCFSHKKPLRYCPNCGAKMEG